MRNTIQKFGVRIVFFLETNILLDLFYIKSKYWKTNMKCFLNTKSANHVTRQIGVMAPENASQK